MSKYYAKKFDIPELDGISQKTMENHLSLYKGYVENANLIHEGREEEEEPEKGTPQAIQHTEAYRRFGFEFDGMRNHELFFSQFEGGAQELGRGNLMKLINREFNSFDNFIEEIKECAMTRGIGWVMAFYDDQRDEICLQWIDEQQNNMLTGLKPILVLDMWEHAYLMDYKSSEKEKYIDALLKNINWDVVENHFEGNV